jgi:signal transduction histidine kinase
MRLDAFLTLNKAALVEIGLSRLRTEFRELPRGEMAPELEAFIDEVVVALRAELHYGADVAPVVAPTGSKVGELMAASGRPIALVARGIGAVSDAIGVVSSREAVDFTGDEYHVLNLCIDNAVATGLEAYEQRALDERQRDHGLREGSFAHELNNAISNVRVGFDILRKGRVGVNSRTGDIVDRGIHRIASLAARSLVGAKLEAGVALERATCAVVDLVTEVTVAAAMRGADCEVSVEEGLTVEADRLLVHSALSNLVENAIKYSPPGSPVSIVARAAPDGVIVEIADRCGGVPPELQTRLFEPFERGTEGRGTGLGLAIARRAAEAHGGRVEFENRPPVGCLFRLVLPAKRS